MCVYYDCLYSSIILKESHSVCNTVNTQNMINGFFHFLCNISKVVHRLVKTCQQPCDNYKCILYFQSIDCVDSIATLLHVQAQACTSL